MISIRCRDCNKELVSYNSKTISCGCPNMATISGDKITAVDLNRVVMINNNFDDYKKHNVLDNKDLMWQEERKKRKVKRLDFEVR